MEVRREERELFFWTAREALKLIGWAALIAYLLISLILGLIVGDSDPVDFWAKLITLFR
jgi:hypothetical protein